jgi:hypothetical protein
MISNIFKTTGQQTPTTMGALIQTIVENNSNPMKETFLERSDRREASFQGREHRVTSRIPNKFSNKFRLDPARPEGDPRSATLWKHEDVMSARAGAREPRAFLARVRLEKRSHALQLTFITKIIDEDRSLQRIGLPVATRPCLQGGVGIDDAHFLSLRVHIMSARLLFAKFLIVQ